MSDGYKFKPTTMQEYRDMLYRHLLLAPWMTEDFANKFLDRISQEQLDKFNEEMETAGRMSHGFGQSFARNSEKMFFDALKEEE